MTQFEKITKSPETLARFIESLACNLLEDVSLMDIEGRKQWLLQEVKEGEDND